jgi:predicted nucleotidyltransferase
LLENILDVDIPLDFFSGLREVDLGGVKTRAVGLEELLVINEVARLVLEHDIRLDYNKIKKYASLYPEDAEGILKRLRRNGIYVE